MGNRTKTLGDKMASKAFKQDLPLEGGYAPVNFKRIPARTIIQGKWLLGAFVAYQTWAAYMYGAYWRPATKARKTEYNGFRLALAPLLQAERDRAYIKQVKKNVAAEEELMADVEGLDNLYTIQFLMKSYFTTFQWV